MLATSDPAEHALAEAALHEADIPFATRNAAIQHLLGAGQIGGVNLVTGPPEIQVASSDASRARNLIREALGDTDPSDRPAELEPETEPFDTSDKRSRAVRYARYSAVWSVLYLFGIGSILGIYFVIRCFTTSRDIPPSQKGLAIFGMVVAVLSLALRAIVLLSPEP